MTAAAPESFLRRLARRAKATLAPRAVILLYHRVADAQPGTDPHNLCVSPARFEEQMRTLRERVPVLPLATLVRHIRERTLPYRCAAVTFDDGYADNLYNAKPVLERHDIPATVFVATGAVGRTEEFYWDECERLILNGPGRLAECVATCDEIRDLPPAARRDRMRQMRAGTEPAVRETHRAMTDEEIVRLADRGLVEVGAHTENHPALPTLPPHEQLDEMARSKSRLESVLGKPVTSFAYPYGLHDAATVDAVRRAGFERACSTLEHAARLESEELCLPRFDMGDCDCDTFARKLRWAFGR